MNVVLVFGCAALFVLGDVSSDAAKKELAPLQGEWAVKSHSGSIPVPDGFRVIIRGCWYLEYPSAKNGPQLIAMLIPDPKLPKNFQFLNVYDAKTLVVALHTIEKDRVTLWFEQRERFQMWTVVLAKSAMEGKPSEK